MQVNKSAYFEFNDNASTVSFVWGVGKSRQRKVLVYLKTFYPTIKRAFQEFLAEKDQRVKLAKLGHALNLGSESGRLSELVFLLEILWRYDFSRVCGENPK